ncbi:hypothetical protein E2542_SST14920 [Spatholobus suberectus]|nr:hypothetical protein E2542_SST14920 [Spatholobus suberectus]
MEIGCPMKTKWVLEGFSDDQHENGYSDICLLRLRKGLAYAWQLGYYNVKRETDCLEVVGVFTIGVKTSTSHSRSHTIKGREKQKNKKGIEGKAKLKKGGSREEKERGVKTEETRNREGGKIEKKRMECCHMAALENRADF